MILPSKKLSPENSLIYIGGKVLAVLDEPKTVSRVWEEFMNMYTKDQSVNIPQITYDWFVLALDLLFVLGAIDLSQGRLRRRST
jgi:ABC-three component (ABC-3C) system Middle Component 6